MKTLVVGGAGYIGGLTVDILLNKGHDVTVYDNLLYETRFLKPCKFIYGDIRDTDKLVSIHDDFDSIIWLAAIVGEGACDHDKALTREVNVNSLKRFLDRTERPIVFTSTCSVYGATDDLVNEESPTNPLSLYAAVKLEAEKFVSDNNGTVFRLGTVYGLGDTYSRIRLDLVVNYLTLKALRDKKLTIYGGQQWRPIISVRDVAEYLSESIERQYNDIFVVKTLNIKIIELTDIVKKIFPDTKVDIVDMKLKDTRSYRVDSSKAETFFSTKPHVTVEEEILKLKKVFEEHRIKETSDGVYYNTKHVKSIIDKRGV